MSKQLFTMSDADLEAPTLIHVVVKHEQEIQELKRLVTPMSMNYEDGYESGYKAGMDENEKREWVGLTDEEINSIEFPESGTATMRDFIKIIEAKLKQKNGGDSAIDKEIQRLGYPL